MPKQEPNRRVRPIRGTMTNLLKETLEAIAKSGHSPADVAFIGSWKTGHQCIWHEFLELARRVGPEQEYVAEDLIIAFVDGTMMWRNDTGEIWEFSMLFKNLQGKRRKKKKAIRRLAATLEELVDGSATLAKLNKGLST